MVDELKKAEEAYRQSKNKKGYNGIYQVVIKRLIDIIVCLLALPFVLILLIPISIAIKVEDRGPVLYR